MKDSMTLTRTHLLAIAWTLGILAACSIPGEDLPRVDLLSFDKTLHFAAFAVFGWLWMRAVGPPSRHRTGWVLAASSAYAVLTEIYQSLLPFERTPDPQDALANLLGLLAAVLLFRVFRTRAEK
ncbi:MAG: VanZ family protein [Rhodothermales bacterium]